jgi:uncharacterized protein YegL
VKNYTDITILLDKSGSMASIYDKTIDAYNEFLHGQSNDGTVTNISLVQFDAPPAGDWYEPVYSEKEVSVAPRLSRENYKPRGGTALNDAICVAVDETGKRLSAKREEDRPNKVLFVILTDGQENSSKLYNSQHVAQKRQHQEDLYSWTFLFLGSNIQVTEQATSYGISAGNMLNFDGDIKYAMGAMASGLMCYKENLVRQTKDFFAEVLK